MTKAPAIGAVEYETIKFQGALLDRNPFKGPPSPALDAAWKEIVNSRFSGINNMEIDSSSHIGRGTDQNRSSRHATFEEAIDTSKVSRRRRWLVYWWFRGFPSGTLLRMISLTPTADKRSSTA